MTHADDPRHIIYSTWVIPKFFPYTRDLLCVLTVTEPAILFRLMIGLMLHQQ
jgi:hypothetical protein